jgi:hypothetical protein
MPKHHTILTPTAASLTLTAESLTVLKQAMQTDLEAQRKAAEIALAEAQKLKTSQDENPQLKEAMDALLKVAQILAANTVATSTAVLDIVSSGQPK